MSLFLIDPAEAVIDAERQAQLEAAIGEQAERLSSSVNEVFAADGPMMQRLFSEVEAALQARGSSTDYDPHFLHRMSLLIAEALEDYHVLRQSPSTLRIDLALPTGFIDLLLPRLEAQ